MAGLNARGLSNPYDCLLEIDALRGRLKSIEMVN